MSPWVTRLLVANVVMFFLTMVFPQLRYALGFVPELVLQRPWTIVTYMFLHQGIPHIFFNMLALYFFGPQLEARLGGSQFLGLYFTSGLVGAALSLATPSVIIVGASGAVFGVLIGFARYWPRARIYIWGVLPIEAWLLVALMTGFSLWSGLSGTGQGVAHFAHLGGFAGGFLYLKVMELLSPARRFRVKAGAAGARPSGGTRRDAARWSAIRRGDLHEVNRAELDRLLDKIRDTGIGSLTPDERAWLDRFSTS